MGCMGLYEKPWVFQKGYAAAELLPPGTPRGAIRANPKTWTREIWREVYSFSEEEGWKPEVNRELLEEHISSAYNVSECYHSEQFTNKRLRRVVEFLNPIFHPNRRERITARLATTYIQAFFEQSFPDWGFLLEEAVMPQLRAIQEGKSFKTFVTPYLMHLYEYCGCLELEEVKMWKQGMVHQDHSPRDIPRLTGESLMLTMSHREASSSRSPGKLGESSRSHREKPPPSRSLKDVPVAEKIAKFTRDVTLDIQKMEMELLEARSLQRALRKVFEVEDNRDILTIARETRGQLTQVRKELWTSQKEHQETRSKAQETMVTLTKLLAGQTSATRPDRSPPRKIRRFIPNPSSSSEEDTPLSYSKSREGSPSSKEWGVKVYKRNRGLPGNLPGKKPVNSTPSPKDSLTETSVAMLMDTVDVSTIPVDTPNLPVDLPVLASNLPEDPSVTIPVDTPSLPVNPSMDPPEATSTLPDESSG